MISIKTKNAIQDFNDPEICPPFLQYFSTNYRYNTRFKSNFSNYVSLHWPIITIKSVQFCGINQQEHPMWDQTLGCGVLGRK